MPRNRRGSRTQMLKRSRSSSSDKEPVTKDHETQPRRKAQQPPSRKIDPIFKKIPSTKDHETQPRRKAQRLPCRKIDSIFKKVPSTKFQESRPKQKAQQLSCCKIKSFSEKVPSTEVSKIGPRQNVQKLSCRKIDSIFKKMSRKNHNSTLSSAKTSFFEQSSSTSFGSDECTKEIEDSFHLPEDIFSDIRGKETLPFSDNALNGNVEMKNCFRTSKNNSATWAEKYRPSSLEGFIGNGDGITKLKDWLNDAKIVKHGQQSEDSSSGDDFLDFDFDDDQKHNIHHLPGLILSGPSGCGKTCAVYAAANDLNYKVLEMNASVKRTKQSLLTDLLEATQSHQVKQTSNQLPGSLLYRFQVDKYEKENTKEDNPEMQKSNLPALILIDEADIVLPNEDEGFESAIKTLLTGSKRPIIFIARTVDCLHLSGIRDLCETIEFSPPPRFDMGSRLHLMCLAEGMLVSRSSIENLLFHSQDDVRCSINQLQFWLTCDSVSSCRRRSNPDGHVMKFPSQVDEYNCSLGNLWWHIPNLIESQNCTSELDDIVLLTESLSRIDIMSRAYQDGVDCEPCPRLWDKKLSRGLSSSEDLRHYDIEMNNVAQSVSYLIIEKSISVVTKCSATENITKGLFERPSEDAIRRRNNSHKVEETLYQAIPSRTHLDRGSITMDYFAVLHLINHLEMEKHAENGKRGRRYSNYLTRLGICVPETTFQLLSKFFKENII